MKNLTPNEIERFVDDYEQLVDAHNDSLKFERFDDEYIVNSAVDILRTALATVQLDQPKQEDLGAFLLTQVIRMEDDKRKHFIRDLAVRYKDDITQPNIDLKEVENIVSVFHRDTHAIIRARIGYTLNDLK